MDSTIAIVKYEKNAWEKRGKRDKPDDSKYSFTNLSFLE